MENEKNTLDMVKAAAEAAMSRRAPRWHYS